MVEYDYGCGVINFFGGHSCLLNCFHDDFMVYRVYLAILLSVLLWLVSPFVFLRCGFGVNNELDHASDGGANVDRDCWYCLYGRFVQVTG